jgi:UDP-N-acetylmuramate dehydrogenase
VSVTKAAERLAGAADLEVVHGERLAQRTSYRIGGPAALTVTVHTYAALVRALRILNEERVEWVVLGRGSNVLVADAGYDGCIVRLGREFSRLSFGDDGQLTVGAGAQLSRVVARCQSEGLSGLEMCVGIPGSVGGAISMNAGTRTEWISSRITSVVTYRPGSGLVRYGVSEIDWGYRRTSLPAGEIILEADLLLEKADPAAIAADMESRMAKRRGRQPLNKPSCGSVFRNPPDRSVGEIIESCGLKGFTCGGAQVSDVHANFVVNNGGATANDVLVVLNKVHDEVLRRYGIELIPEVKFLGFQ